MRGVTTASGSSEPAGTTSVTCAITVRAAVAITGPKLRAVLRYTRFPSSSARQAEISATSPWMGYSSR